MRATLRAPLLLLLIVGALSGCGRNSPLATSSDNAGDDQTQVASEMSRQPAVVEDGVSDSQEPVSYGSEGPGLAAIHPLNFWRTIRERERRFEFVFSDTDSTGRPTRAIVTIRTHLQGSFNIAVGEPGSDGAPLDSSRRVIHKPLEELRVRRVLLRRVPDRPDDPDSDPSNVGRPPRWRVAAVSGVEVSSKDHTSDVLSLRVQSGALDTTLTDPLAFIRLRGLLKLQVGAGVTLTVTTGRSDDIVVLHHNELRFRLHNNGDNTYSGQFRTGLFARGLHHFGVDALSNGTLFDDALPYDSQRWVLPYVIAPELLAGPPL